MTHFDLAGRVPTRRYETTIDVARAMRMDDIATDLLLHEDRWPKIEFEAQGIRDRPDEIEGRAGLAELHLREVAPRYTRPIRDLLLSQVEAEPRVTTCRPEGHAKRSCVAGDELPHAVSETGDPHPGLIAERLRTADVRR